MFDEYDFICIFGMIDDKFIYDAGKDWKHRKISKQFMKVAGVVLAILISLSCAFHTQVSAGIQKALSYIADVLGLQEDISLYTEIIDKTVIKNGISVTIKEVVTDGRELVVVYEVSGDSEEELFLNEQLTIDGEIVQSAEGYNLPYDERKSCYQRIECYRLSNEISKKNMHIKIVMHPDKEPYWSKSFDETNNFVFSFEASKEELQMDTIDIVLNQEIEIPNHSTIYLKKFTLNALDSTIIGESTENLENFSYYFKGQDSLGNKVMYRSDQYLNPNWEFVEERSKSYISPNAEWVELQLYIHECESTNVVQTENGEVIEETGDCDNPYEMYPVGDKFVIYIKNKERG